MTSIKQRNLSSIFKFCRKCIIIIALVLFISSCKRESEVKEIIITDTAQVKREELSKEALNLYREESAKQTQLALLRTAEAKERIAKAKLMEEEAKLAREQLEHEKEIRDDKIALEEEVATIAAASEQINIFIADLRSRQGKQQLKLKNLPYEIKKSQDDLIFLSKTLSSYKQGVVT
ncbi:MAG: hypothetical protein M0P27_03390 [Bacteroidales bacterium]|nr:hypothetical protein [Bacteroidales bacterium]